ncbi:MAG: glutathione peroxidase [Myxococcota bacterium]
MLYDIALKTLQGQDTSLREHEGKVVLIVNVASRCGYTPQYKGLEELYQDGKGQGLVVLGFPCNQFGAQEPGSNDEIATFCEKNYGVTFPLFDKIDVNGPNAHPLYTALKAAGGSGDIKWNFEKFLVSREGTVLKHFPSGTTPAELAEEVAPLLG